MKRNLPWFCLALTAMLMICFSVAPGAIEAKQMQTPGKGHGQKHYSNKPQMYLIPTSNSKKAHQVIRQLQQGKSPKALGLVSPQHHSPRKQTLKKMEAEASKSQQTYPVEAGSLNSTADDGVWTPPPFDYDDIKFDQCVNNDKASGGWIKNHYSYCWSNYIVYSDPAGCGPSWFPFGCDWVSFRLTVMGYGSNGQRVVSYTYKIDDIDMDLDSSGWIGSKVSVSIKCDGISENRDCLGDESPDKRTLAHWRSNDQGTTLFDSEPPPVTAGNKDQVSYMDLWPRVTVDPPGKKYPPITSDGPKETVRMDSADYLFVFRPFFYPKEGAVFADADPVFYYDMNDPYFSIMKPAFQHAKDALTAPGSIVPGIKGRPPLTRLYPKYDHAQYKANIAAKNKACAKLHKRPDYECDEFPFASTYEGAGKIDGQFSVRYIPRAANNAHGRWLAAWYAYARILHKDHFYIGFRY